MFTKNKNEKLNYNIFCLAGRNLYEWRRVHLYTVWYLKTPPPEGRRGFRYNYQGFIIL
jgi:hypothetical protein